MDTVLSVFVIESIKLSVFAFSGKEVQSNLFISTFKNDVLCTEKVQE